MVYKLTYVHLLFIQGESGFRTLMDPKLVVYCEYWSLNIHSSIPLSVTLTNVRDGYLKRNISKGGPKGKMSLI